jgi:biotin synthase
MVRANSILTGNKHLTAANAGDDKDAAMLAKFGLVPMVAEERLRACKALEAAK